MIENFITIENILGIHKIIDEIHDMRFDVKDIKYDKSQNKIEIEYLYEKNAELKLNLIILQWYRIPLVKRKLIIHQVKKFQIFDTEKIVTYMFNDIIFENESRTMIIKAEPNLEIKLDIEKVLIKLAPSSKEIIQEKNRFGLFGIIEFN